MRKIFIIGGLIFLFFIFKIPAFAQTDLSAEDWVIENFQSDIRLRQDAGFQVEENILADFRVRKHGIFRYIPLRYKTGKIFKYYLSMDLRGIYKKDETEWNYERTKSGSFWEYKIGDPDRYLTGEQLYRIVYDVERGIRFFDDHDELYWNVTGTDWEAPIENVSATVFFPKEITADKLKFQCYTGRFGSKEQNCNYTFNKKENKVTFTSVEKNPYKNFMTIAIWMPKGYLTKPSQISKIGYFIKDNYSLAAPIVAFIVMFVIWYKKGRDPKEKKPVIAQYDAADFLTPSLVKVIEDESKFDAHDLPAEIVHLATMRILKIKEIDVQAGEYKIIRKRDWEKNKKLTSYQKYLLDQIFPKNSKGERPKEIDLKNLKKSFDYKDAKEYTKLAKEHIEKKNYYLTSVSAKSLYLGICILLFMLSVMWGIYNMSFVDFAAGALTTIIVAVFGYFMPKKSKKGMDMLWYIKGLKKYIDVAEAHRIEHEEAMNIFSKVLPFAMVLGMTKKWATVFKDLIKEPPEWLEVSNPKLFTTAFLASALSTFETKTYKSFAAAYRKGGSASSSGFSGGGFSGGGFGGGGGGSW